MYENKINLKYRISIIIKDRFFPWASFISYGKVLRMIKNSSSEIGGVRLKTDRHPGFVGISAYFFWKMSMAKNWTKNTVGVFLTSRLGHLCLPEFKLPSNLLQRRNVMEILVRQRNNNTGWLQFILYKYLHLRLLFRILEQNFLLTIFTHE